MEAEAGSTQPAVPCRLIIIWQFIDRSGMIEKDGYEFFYKDILYPAERIPKREEKLPSNTFLHGKARLPTEFTVSLVRKYATHIEVRLRQMYPPLLTIEDLQQLRKDGWNILTAHTPPPQRPPS